MEGKCPYPYIYELTKQSTEVLTKYKEIIENYKKNGEKFVDSDFSLENCGERIEDLYSIDLFDNISPNGILQGSYGDCFLISCLIKISNDPSLVKSLFVDPDIQSGCVCVNFTCIGRPYYVIIDTFIPSQSAKTRGDNDSYWFILIEKAYAKLMGDYDKLGGNSTNAMNVMFGWFSITKKVKALKQNVLSTLNTFLDKSNFVYAAITTNTACKKVNILSNHGYVVVGVDTVNNDTLVHLIDPHGKSDYDGPYSASSKKWTDADKEAVSFQTNGHFWLPINLFSEYFDSISYSDPLPNKKFTKSFEFDIEPGEMDGRFFAGDGPYVGGLPQWKVTFSKKCQVDIYCVAASKSENVLGFAMCPNNGQKIGYKKLEDVPIKYAYNGSEIIETADIMKAGTPYTIAVSRKAMAKHPVHIYCRLECQSSFELEKCEEVNKEEMNHVTASGRLLPGPNDGRSKFGNSSLEPVEQWNLIMDKPGNLFIHVNKTPNCESQHTFFIAVPNNPGKYSKGGKFYSSIIINKRVETEDDIINITDNKQYICVGVTRDKAKAATDFSFDIYSTSGLELNPITKASHKAPANNFFDEVAGFQSNDFSYPSQKQAVHPPYRKQTNANAPHKQEVHPPYRKQTNANAPHKQVVHPPYRKQTNTNVPHKQEVYPPRNSISQRPKKVIVKPTVAHHPPSKAPKGKSKNAFGEMCDLYSMMENL